MPTVGAGFSHVAPAAPSPAHRAVGYVQSRTTPAANDRPLNSGLGFDAATTRGGGPVSPQTILSCCGSFWEEQPVLSSAPPDARATVTRQRQPECADHE